MVHVLLVRIELVHNTYVRHAGHDDKLVPPVLCMFEYAEHVVVLDPQSVYNVPISVVKQCVVAVVI